MSHGARVGSLLVLPLLALVTFVLSAAGQSWVVDASAGGAEYKPIAAGISTRSAILGLHYQDVPWLYIAAGMPLDSGGLPWGAGGLGSRLETRMAGVELGADVAVHAFGYRDPSLGTWGVGGSTEALPFVALSRGSARLELQTGLLHFQSRFGETTLRQTLHQSVAQLFYRPAPQLSLTGEARLARADEGDYPYAGASAELSFSRGELWGDFGRWISEDMTTPEWSIGGSAQLTERIRMRAWYAQESENPLYWNLPRRSWNIGVSHTLGRVPGTALAMPLPLAPEVVGGKVILRLPLDEADAAPAVAGDFNQWKPVMMTRSQDAWVVSLAVPPGVYHYAFRRKDGSWFVPESVPNRVDDGFGGFSAVLVVPASSRS